MYAGGTASRALEQWSQTTCPQRRQWCLRRKSVKPTSHTLHELTSWSATHDAVLPAWIWSESRPERAATVCSDVKPPPLGTRRWPRAGKADGSIARRGQSPQEEANGSGSRCVVRVAPPPPPRRPSPPPSPPPTPVLLGRLRLPADAAGVAAEALAAASTASAACPLPRPAPWGRPTTHHTHNKGADLRGSGRRSREGNPSNSATCGQWHPRCAAPRQAAAAAHGRRDSSRPSSSPAPPSPSHSLTGEVALLSIAEVPPPPHLANNCAAGAVGYARLRRLQRR